MKRFAAASVLCFMGSLPAFGINGWGYSYALTDQFGNAFQESGTEFQATDNFEQMNLDQFIPAVGIGMTDQATGSSTYRCALGGDIYGCDGGDGIDVYYEAGLPFVTMISEYSDGPGLYCGYGEHGVYTPYGFIIGPLTNGYGYGGNPGYTWLGEDIFDEWPYGGGYGWPYGGWGGGYGYGGYNYPNQGAMVYGLGYTDGGCATVSPYISSVDPAVWPAGGNDPVQFTISGSSFGNPDQQGTLPLSGAGFPPQSQATVVTWGNKQILAQVVVPSTAGGIGQLIAQAAQGQQSAPAQLTVQSCPVPNITTISDHPESGSSGIIVIAGQYLSDNGANPIVTIQGVAGNAGTVTAASMDGTQVSAHYEGAALIQNNVHNVSVTTSCGQGNTKTFTTGSELLLCDNQFPVRADVVTCTVSVSPASQISWDFAVEPSTMVTVTGPTVTDTFSQWAGRIVTTGVVRATVNGRTLTSAITVSPRSWTRPTAPTPVKVANGNTAVGPAVGVPTGVGSIIGMSAEGFTTAMLQVPTGPNKDYLYVSSPAVAWYKYFILSELEMPSSDFYQHQYGDYDPVNKPMGVICISELKDGTIRHESGSSASHYAVQYLPALAMASDPNAAIEDRTQDPQGGGTVIFGPLIQSMLDNVGAAIHMQMLPESPIDPPNNDGNGNLRGYVNIPSYVPGSFSPSCVH